MVCLTLGLAFSVRAFSVVANVDVLTLIDVLAFFVLCSPSVLESFWTIAFVASFQILTDCVDASISDFLAFVGVTTETLVIGESVARLTLARVASNDVDASAVLTDALDAAALVDVKTVAFLGQSKTLVAFAEVGASRVGAGAIAADTRRPGGRLADQDDQGYHSNIFSVDPLLVATLRPANISAVR
jgi:hypothetical protein